MTPPSTMRVVFRAAAGPRIGFGHLVRCRSLARALGVPPIVSIRGALMTRRIAAENGWATVDPRTSAALGNLGPDLVVVDDPDAHAAAIWIARARRTGVPVAAVHDLGLGYVPSDLGIDGSIEPRPDMHGRYGDLRGPAHAVLDPSIAAAAARRHPAAPPEVLVGLGGGGHVFALAAAIASAVARALAGTRVRVAAGFSRDRLPSLAAGEWYVARDGLAEALATASVAVVAGGMTLYEACAIGVPTVAVALTPAQHVTIRAFARRGIVIDAGVADDRALPERVSDAVAALALQPHAAARRAGEGRVLVDGRGVFRVADALRQLVADCPRGARDAA